MRGFDEGALFRRVLLLSAICTGGATAAGILLGFPLELAVVLTGFVAFELVCWRLLTVLPVSAVGWLYFGVLIPGFAALGYLGGGLGGQAFSTVMLPVCAAALVFGRRGAVLAGSWALVTAAGVAWLEERGLPPVPPTTPWQRLHPVAATTALVGLIATAVHEAMRRTGERLTEKARQLATTASMLETEVKQHRLAQQQLTEAYQQAVQAERVKGVFLATMSHELRTPMNAVVGLTDLLLKDPLGEVQREHLETIQASGQALLALLDDVLDFSKMEAGAMRLDSVAFDPRAVAEQARRLFHPRARARELDLTVEVDGAVPAALVGDPLRLGQVLANLLSNAIKFTARGGVRAHLGWAAGRLTVQVADTGMGMTAEQVRGLFQPFQQGDASMTRRFGGTGLGLAIVKRLCELMGGGVSVESAPGSGSTFTATVAMDRSDTAVARKPPSGPRPAVSVPWPGLKVLVAEDNPVNQMVARRLLERIGIHAEVVEDGRRAVERVCAEHPHVVLMDLQMPELDGLSATRAIRALDGPQPWIIALTASALKEHEEASVAAGVDAFLAKPVTLEALESALATAHRRLGCREQVGASGNDRAGPPAA